MDVVALGFYEGRKIVMTEITIFFGYHSKSERICKCDYRYGWGF